MRSGSRHRCTATSRSALGGEPVNPLEMARAYASFANGGRRIDGSMFGNEPRAVVSGRSRREPRRAEPPVGHRGARTARTAIVNQLLAGRGRGGTGHGRRRSRAARSRARPGRPRTTVTHGSSATRRSSSIAVWVGYPDREADEYRVPRQARRRRHVPALIWKTFTESRAEPAAASRRVTLTTAPCHPRHGRARRLPRRDRPSSTTAPAGTRSSSSTSTGAARRRRPTAS